MTRTVPQRRIISLLGGNAPKGGARRVIPIPPKPVKAYTRFGTPLRGRTPFDGKPAKKPLYKIYNDGSHYIATKVVKSSFAGKRVAAVDDERNSFFDCFYFAAMKQGLRGNERSGFIKTALLRFFPDSPDLDGYIEERIKRKLNNLGKRKKRFCRKAHLNEWNYFVTFTYNDLLHDEDTFRKKLRKCLSNLHTRHGWRYMGVFERAPETGRLHFHAIVFVPDGKMVGRITEVRDYDKASGKMRVHHENTFFTANYGRNDFEPLDPHALKSGQSMNYLLKYIGKTNDRVCYSRGIPEMLVQEVEQDDLAAEMADFVTKYVLFDDVVEQTRAHSLLKRKGKQMTLIDCMCNPSY
jgi:hypothetical protein